jgi:hypothetical protein
VEVVIDEPSRRPHARLLSLRSPNSECPVSAAHRKHGPGSVGQERGQAKIASGWPRGFDTLARHFLTPGSHMTANRVQASLSQQLAASASSRRRIVPPSPSESVWQPLNQRWRERPRCPAPRVTPGRRDGVVHAIVGRAACRCLRAQFVQDERAARVHVFVSRFAGTTGRRIKTEIGLPASHVFPEGTSRFGSRSCRRTIARFMLAPGSASSMLFAALRPGRWPGLRALTTPPRGTSRALTRWWSA